jgi:hypothetical protein
MNEVFYGPLPPKPITFDQTPPNIISPGHQSYIVKQHQYSASNTATPSLIKYAAMANGSNRNGRFQVSLSLAFSQEVSNAAIAETASAKNPEARNTRFDRLTVAANKPSPSLAKRRQKRNAVYELLSKCSISVDSVMGQTAKQPSAWGRTSYVISQFFHTSDSHSGARKQPAHDDHFLYILINRSYGIYCSEPIDAISYQQGKFLSRKIFK